MGSIPITRLCGKTIENICASGSAVEHLLAKEGVAGSIPVSRFFCVHFDCLIVLSTAEPLYHTYSHNKSMNISLYRSPTKLKQIVVSCNHNRNPPEKVNFLCAVTISIVQMLLAKASVNLSYSHHGWYSYRDMEILVSCRLFLPMRVDASSVSASRLEIREVRAKK